MRGGARARWRRALARPALAALARAAGVPLAARVRRPAPADAIAVLGCPLRGDGSLSSAGEERVRTGAALYRRALAPVVCVVGGRDPSRRAQPVAEAEVMAAALVARGVPAAALRIDRASSSTQSNANAAAGLLLPEGRRRVWIVTQPFHLRRACWYFRRAGLDPLPWYIADSVQYRFPALALRWIAREYAAWALALARVVPAPPGSRK